ncbi:cation exchanger 11 isoform X1 [Wolffia australiana]
MARACAHLSLLCILFLFSIALAIAVAILFLDFDPSNFYPNSGHGDRSSSIFNHDPPKFFPNSHHGDRSTSIFNHDPSNFSPSSGHGDRSSSIFNHDPPNFFPSSGHGDRSSSIFNHGPPNFFPNSHHGDRSSSIFNYDALSIPSLSLFLLFLFFFLMKVAGDHFSPAVSLLSDHLRLSPSKAAVTLLALGNGAPDVFSSVAAVRHGQPRTGLGAILSAGAFVSSLVLGFVAINASPFSVQPASFVRDAFFYLVAASALFYVYLSAEIYLWQALGFVLFYVFFVWVVFRMDSACGEEDGVEILAGEVEIEKGLRDEILKPPPASLDAIEASDSDRSFAFMGFFRKHMSSRISVGPGSMGMGGVPSSDILSISTYHVSNIRAWAMVGQVALAWEAPTSAILKLTIPSPRPQEWTRLYSAAHIALCPPAFLVLALCQALPNRHHPTAFLLSAVVPVPFAAASYLLPKNIPPSFADIPATLLAFIMAAVWISAAAAELVSCLAALGRAAGLAPSILGLTLLAWGNSAGDLAAEIAVARAGRPAMAVAGCFAGPMFNMLVGLGGGLAAAASDVYPRAFQLTFHVSIAVAFGFLLLSLMGSLFVVTWCHFRVPRVWGFCLVALYAVFTAVSLAVAAL